MGVQGRHSRGAADGGALPGGGGRRQRDHLRKRRRGDEHEERRMTSTSSPDVVTALGWHRGRLIINQILHTGENPVRARVVRLHVERARRDVCCKAVGVFTGVCGRDDIS